MLIINLESNQTLALLEEKNIKNKNHTKPDESEPVFVDHEIEE